MNSTAFSDSLTFNYGHQQVKVFTCPVKYLLDGFVQNLVPDIHGSQRINPLDLTDPLIFPLAPP